MFDFQLHPIIFLGLIAFVIIFVVVAHCILLRKIYKNLLKNNKRLLRKQKIGDKEMKNCK